MLAGEGTYYADILEAGCDELPNENKTPYVYIKIHVTHVAAEGTWRSLTQSLDREVRLYMTEKSWKYSEKRLAALGFEGDFDAIKFSKTGAEFLCTHNPRQGKVYEKWDVSGEWNSGERGHQAVSKDLIRKLNAQWKTGIGQAVSSLPDAGETTSLASVSSVSDEPALGAQEQEASPPDSSPVRDEEVPE